MLTLPYQVILGSKSPRRQELLASLDISFEVRKIEIDESFPNDLQPSDVPEFLAQKKGKHQQSILQDNEMIITSDTIVVCDNQTMGKPKDENEAKAMLWFLSNKTHQVITGVCITTKEKTISFSDMTEVTFKELTEEQIDYYVQKYKPFDKAGSYGIQEWIGMTGISGIKGSFYNVMGLPVEKLFDVLRKF